MTPGEIFLIIITFLVMLVGVAGVVIPILPDVWLIWLAAVGYGLLQQPLFDGWIGGIAMFFITLLTAAGLVADWLLVNAGAKQGGASWQGIVASIVLGLVGLPFFPPIGSLVGALLGLFAVEYFKNGKDVKRAWEAVKGFAAGCGFSLVARLAISGAMIGIWGVWVWVSYLVIT